MAAILMVDDERPILELVKNGLQKDGHFITAYTSAAQVPLDKLNRYDLIILDIMMPDIWTFQCKYFIVLQFILPHFQSTNCWFISLRRTASALTLH